MDKRSELEQKTRQGDISAGLELADLSEKSGDIDEARRLYEWLADDLESVTAAMELARIAYEAGDYASIPKWVSYANGNGLGSPDFFWEDLAKFARSSDPKKSSQAKAAIRACADQGSEEALDLQIRLTAEQGRIAAARHMYEQALVDGLIGDDPELATLLEDDETDAEKDDSDEWRPGLTRVGKDVRKGSVPALSPTIEPEASTIEARIAAGDKVDLVAMIEEPGVVATLTPDQQVALAKHRSVDVPRALAQHAPKLSLEAVRVLAKSRIFTARRNLAESGGAALPDDVIELLANDDDSIVRATIEKVRQTDETDARLNFQQTRLGNDMSIGGPTTGHDVNPEEEAPLLIEGLAPGSLIAASGSLTFSRLDDTGKPTTSVTSSLRLPHSDTPNECELAGMPSSLEPAKWAAVTVGFGLPDSERADGRVALTRIGDLDTSGQQMIIVCDSYDDISRSALRQLKPWTSQQMIIDIGLAGRLLKISTINSPFSAIYGQGTEPFEHVLVILENDPVALGDYEIPAVDAAAMIKASYDLAPQVGGEWSLGRYAGWTGSPIIDCHLTDWLAYANSIGPRYAERLVTALADWWPREFETTEDQVISAEFHQSVRDLAELGHLQAMREAGWICLVNDDDPAAARRYWARAAEAGDATAMFDLGFLSKQLGDEATARAWYSNAAANGISDAADALAELDGVERDSPRVPRDLAAPVTKSGEAHVEDAPVAEPRAVIRVAKARHQSLVCTNCWKYCTTNKCKECKSADYVIGTSELSPTELAILWSNNEGRNALDAFIRDAAGSDTLDQDLSSIANWKSFLRYLDEGGISGVLLSDGTRLDDPKLGEWILDEWLLDLACETRSID
jgi:hypothetical protein